MCPAPLWIGYWLRNYGAQGVLGRLAALVLGRPCRYTPEMTQALYAEVRRVLAECGHAALPVAKVEGGHTRPQLTLPVGCRAAVDPVARTLAVLEAPTADD